MAFDNDQLGMPAPNAAPISGSMPAPIAPAPDMSPAPAAPDLGPGDAGNASPSSVPSAKGPSKYGASDAPMRPWVKILQGALWGLSGPDQKGRGSFGSGLVSGAQGYAGMKFASAKAADDHIRAMKEARLVDLQTDEAKLNLQMQYQNIAAVNKLFGIKPSGTIGGGTEEEMNAQAIGAHQVMAAASPDGNTLPALQTVSSPFGQGDEPGKHVIDYYNPPSAQDLEQNPNGYRNFVAEGFKADGRIFNDQIWQTANGAVKPGEKPNALNMLSQQREGQSQMVQDTYKSLYAPFGGKEVVTTGARSPEQITSMNAGTSAGLHQRADKYDKLTDANPSISKLLQGQAISFDNEVERQRGLAAAAKSTTIQATASAEAAAAAQKMGAEEAEKFNVHTPAGLLNVQKAQQDLLDKKMGNVEKSQKQLFEIGIAPDPADPTKQLKLNLSTPGAEEMLVDERTGQPIPTKNVNAVKPTMQETNRADFAKSTLHILDKLDDLKKQGKLPNGPFSGVSAENMAKLGFGKEDAQTALDLISLGQSASTGAHVGGRFNQEIMEKMSHVISINMNDSQFQGAEDALRFVMGGYVRDGGRESVTAYKQHMLGQTKSVNGKEYAISGFDPSGNFVLTATGK
jgi:dsDNA-binding SOS-regulon protein